MILSPPLFGKRQSIIGIDDPTVSLLVDEIFLEHWLQLVEESVLRVLFQMIEQNLLGNLFQRLTACTLLLCDNILDALWSINSNTTKLNFGSLLVWNLFVLADLQVTELWTRWLIAWVARTTITLVTLFGLASFQWTASRQQWFITWPYMDKVIDLEQMKIQCVDTEMPIQSLQVIQVEWTRWLIAWIRRTATTLVKIRGLAIEWLFPFDPRMMANKFADFAIRSWRQMLQSSSHIRPCQAGILFVPLPTLYIDNIVYVSISNKCFRTFIGFRLRFFLSVD